MYPTIAETAMPIRNSCAGPVCERLPQELQTLVGGCRGDGRHAEQEREARRRVTAEPEEQRERERRARARHAGHERRRLCPAEREGLPRPEILRLPHPSGRPLRPQQQHPADRQRDARDGWPPERVLDVPEKKADDDDGNRADRDQPRHAGRLVLLAARARAAPQSPSATGPAGSRRAPPAVSRGGRRHRTPARTSRYPSRRMPSRESDGRSSTPAGTR